MQVQALTGLNQEARGLYRDENVFEDADVQMAGYAAALRALTRYARIDGRDMTSEAIRPRVKNETTFVDDLIAFAVDTANQCLVPQGIANSLWERLSGAERFYLKMLDIEARGAKTLDNYQNFAKAFKVRDFYVLMGDRRANHARLKGAVEFGRTEMGEGSELHGSVLRAVLYAARELQADVDATEVLCASYPQRARLLRRPHAARTSDRCRRLPRRTAQDAYGQRRQARPVSLPRPCVTNG